MALAVQSDPLVTGLIARIRWEGTLGTQPSATSVGLEAGRLKRPKAGSWIAPLNNTPLSERRILLSKCRPSRGESRVALGSVAINFPTRTFWVRVRLAQAKNDTSL